MWKLRKPLVVIVRLDLGFGLLVEPVPRHAPIT
jgi:hypothetical protein